jgi:hypothetical protein
MFRRWWMDLPKLVRFMLTHAANGMAIGCAALLGAIWFDLLGVGALLAKDRSGLATAVLFFQTALTFGAVSMGVAVMNLGEPRD